jgi:hypothetical protein
VADGVDASMQAMQEALARSASNRGPRKAELHELPQGHDAVLPLRESR